MDPNYLLATVEAQRLVAQQIQTPEREHYVAALAARRASRHGFARRMRQLRLVAGRTTAAAAEPRSS